MNMNDNRDMFYNSYGYSGFTPPANMPNNMPPMMNNQMPNQTFEPMPLNSPTNTYQNSQLQDMNERISRLERQVKRLDQRLTRLETPYANTNNQAPEPDNNMYMM